MRRFCLYRRGKIWYAKFYNPSTKTYMTGRSTGELNRDAALLTVAEWLSGGVPEPKQKGTRPIATAFEIHSVMTALRALPLTMVDAEKVVAILRDRELIETALAKAGPGSEPFISFLERFWNYDASPYVREKLAHDQRISRRHCYCAGLDVRKHWKPYFGERRLVEIRKADLQAFALWLKDKGQKGKTVNNILAAGTVALHYAQATEMIPSNPAAGLMKFGGKPERRGVLTEQEVERLFSREWADERAYLGNALSMSAACAWVRCWLSRCGTSRTCVCVCGTRGPRWID